MYFKNKMSLDVQLNSLHAQKQRLEKQIRNVINMKQSRIQHRETKPSRPDNWKYKNDVVRTTHFDERVLANGNTPDVPRMVTIVWSHNRDTGMTRYGAVVWSSNPGSLSSLFIFVSSVLANPRHRRSAPGISATSENECDKKTQRKYALERYNDCPVLVRLDPVPKTNYDVQTALRMAVHDMGVSSASKTYQRWLKKTQSTSSQFSKPRK